MENDLKLHSRHIFDIYMLLPKMTFDDRFAELIKEVRAHRQMMGRCPSSAPEINILHMIKEIIENRVYEKDYEDITSYFQKTKVDYDEAITALQTVIEISIF